MASFDVVGSREKAVAIVEVPAAARRKAKGIAAEIMRKHKNVRSVLLKSSPRKGVYRTRKLKLVAGGKNTEVLHIEHGMRFLLDPKKVYFSPREATERQRVAAMVQEGEFVMVFFAGVGPLAIAAAKMAKAQRVIGIELNPDAVRYFRKNVKLNKVTNVEVVKGDVKEKARRFYGMCDRVVMPLPEKAAAYLEDAIRCVRPSGVVHLYCFSKDEDIGRVKDTVKSIAAQLKRKVRFGEVQHVLPYAPRVWKCRVDFTVHEKAARKI
ncbi:MAG: methyltransferase domain-containing protein [Candidatus Aenigmarchaeota archaeon]|nr:methyltransferase domain-containing protein [Candidatus Aenigmarchaeota archaeon]